MDENLDFEPSLQNYGKEILKDKFVTMLNFILFYLLY